MNTREAALSDAKDLAELSSQLGYPATEAEMARRLSRLLPMASHKVFVLEDEGRVLGWIHVTYVLTLEADPRAEIHGLVVRDGFRGQGVGKRLVVKAQEWGRQQGFPVLRVRTNAIRDEAHAFYEHLDFNLAKQQKVYDFLL